MSVESIIKSLEDKVKTVEQNVASALANYHGLTGILAGIKDALAEAKNVAAFIAPSSEVANVIDIANEVVDSVNDVLKPSPVQEDVPQ